MIRRKITVFFSLFCVLSFTYFSARATGDANNHSEKKFDAGQMILHHIGDAHDWHLFDIGEHPVSIPLPVIIYDKAKGISVFSSSKFEHGHAIYNGYKLEHEHIVAVNEQGEKDEATTANIYDFSITKNVAAMLISMAILLYLFISIAKRYKEDSNRAPKGLQSFLEPVIVFIRDDVAKSAIGEKKYEKFMPFLLTVFFFIFLNNLMGLVPIFREALTLPAIYQLP
jgi:F-type H+-transporting ATPase subunit a